jgi:hypothetical protein
VLEAETGCEAKQGFGHWSRLGAEATADYFATHWNLPGLGLAEQRDYDQVLYSGWLKSGRSSGARGGACTQTGLAGGHRAALP